MLFLGGIFYIGLLLINAVAVLSEDRFLARSACPLVMAVFQLQAAYSSYSRMVIIRSTTK